MQIGDLHFLVADADDFQRRWLCAVLAGLGAVEITEVDDGRSAFGHLTAAEPGAAQIDIGLVDLKLPGMDGIELIRSLAAARPAVALVLVSSLDPSLTFSVASLARACGVDLLGTLDKPATPEALQTLLRQYKPLDRRAAPRADLPAATEEELHRALEEGEFEPMFQPKVALADGHVHGVEAFARWRHPQHGLLMPGSFIPALERMGEMTALSWRMLEQSALAMKQWAAAGHHLPVSLNLSPSTLGLAGFAERVGAFLSAQDIAPASLIIEVTETAAISDLPEFLENLARLRMLGCILSVDDFGTGQTSMQDMMRIPFSEVKIDRSFVAGAARDRGLEVVLAASLDMCRKLGRDSVAVGVESQSDWDFLRKLGCQYAQGYYIARPMEAAAVPAWLEEWAQFF